MRQTCTWILAVLLSGPSLLAARKALVIGNADYDDEEIRLTAPVNDAEDLEKLLSTMQFTVTLERNLKKADFDPAIDRFVGSLAEGDTALFFYAGHAIQVNGTNYLWPVDRGFVNEDDIEDDLISIQTLYNGLRDKRTAVNIVILDACRDNAFAPHMVAPYIPGLALPRAIPDSSFIAYSTQANDIALDIDVGTPDRVRSPYTNALISQIGRIGVPITDVFRDVRNIVESTTTRQIPAVENTLDQVFYFRPPIEIHASLEDVDDMAVVTLDGVEQFSTIRDRNGRGNLRLHGGENEIAVVVLNNRSFTGGIEFLGGQKPEGWRYRAQFRDAGQNPLLLLQDGEDTPKKDGPRHGQFFTVASFRISVDEQTGAVELQEQTIDLDRWKRAGLPERPTGVLTDEVRKNLAWAMENEGAVDCVAEYRDYPDCRAAGGRSCLMRRAVTLAKSGLVAEAFRLALITQCHNRGAREAMERAGIDVVTSWLRLQE